MRKGVPKETRPTGLTGESMPTRDHWHCMVLIAQQERRPPVSFGVSRTGDDVDAYWMATANARYNDESKSVP